MRDCEDPEAVAERRAGLAFDSRTGSRRSGSARFEARAAAPQIQIHPRPRELPTSTQSCLHDPAIGSREWAKHRSVSPASALRVRGVQSNRQTIPAESPSRNEDVRHTLRRADVAGWSPPVDFLAGSIAKQSIRWTGGGGRTDPSSVPERRSDGETPCGLPCRETGRRTCGHFVDGLQMRSSSAEPKFFNRATAPTSRRRSSNWVLLTEIPKYCPMTSSISCASSKMTAEYSGMIWRSRLPSTPDRQRTGDG